MRASDRHSDRARRTRALTTGNGQSEKGIWAMTEHNHDERHQEAIRLRVAGADYYTIATELG